MKSKVLTFARLGADILPVTTDTVIMSIAYEEQAQRGDKEQ